MEEIFAQPQPSHNHWVIKIPNFFKFYGKARIDIILYKDWLLQTKNKLQANAAYMPTKSLKMSYIQSFVANNALAQISSRISDNVAKPFKSAKEMLKILIAGFGNANKKKEARAVYKSLRQGTKEFSSFWAEFQKLTQLLNHSDETLIADLIEKSNAFIQRQLSTGEQQPINFIKLT